MPEYKIGKIFNLEKEHGVGYVLSDNIKYLFTKNDTKEFNELNDGDTVSFSAENVNGSYRAFFVKRI